MDSKIQIRTTWLKLTFGINTTELNLNVTYVPKSHFENVKRKVFVRLAALKRSS